MSNIDLYINFDGVGKILRYRDSVFYAVLNGIEQALPLDSGLRVQYSADNSSWHDTVTTGDKYIRVSTNSGATWQSGIKFAGDNGTNGITYTPYTAYASDDAGTGFSLTWNDTLKYTATVHSTTVLANPTLANFTSLGAVWKKFIGDPGQQGNPGNPGATYYPYTAYASAADGTGFSLTWNDTLKYTATVFSTSVIASPALSDFTTLGAVWKKFIGDKGDPGDPATNIITSVNSQTGAVVLDAEDVDAEPSGAVSTHNTDTGAHADKFGGKVDKITGKGLSTEDYTTAEKTKLSGIEAGAEVNVNADWNATSGDAQILNKPTIPDAQIQADWNQTTDTAKDYIKNKPTIPTNSSFTLAGLGEKSYINLTDKPIIPAAQVQSDWNAASGMGQILNKPTIPSKTSDLTNDSGFTTDSAVASGYVAKSTGYSLVADAQITKLGNLPVITSIGTGLSLASGILTANIDLSGYSLATHTHDYSTVYAALNHTHSGYAASSHTHAYGDVTGLTASRVVVSDATGKLSASSITATVLGYLDATSSIQTQLNAKQATITGAATTITTSNMTASRALVSDSSGKVAVSAITATELGYLDNVTSNIQTQLNGKSDTGHTHSYLSDAPTDGSEYVRKNGAWSVASGGAALATTTTAGIVQIGTNISVSSGVISVATASTSALGVARFSSTYFTVASGIVSIKLASTSVKGVSEFSPSYFSVSSGVVSILETSASVTGAVLGASAAEVAAGTSTSYRAFTPAQIKSMVETFAPDAGIPPGSVLPFAGNIPSGFIELEYDKNVTRSTYSNLFSALGTKYGKGDGSTTFGLPDANLDIENPIISNALPVAKHLAGVTLLSDGRILVIGGYSSASGVLASCHIGTISGSEISWTETTALPVALYGSTVATLSDGRIIVVGGSNTSLNSVNTIYFGTVSGDTITWTLSASTYPTVIREHASLLLDDGRLACFGGYSTAATTAVYLGTISGTTVSWAAGTAFGTAWRNPKAVRISSDTFLIMSGLLGSSVTGYSIIGVISGNTITWTGSTALPAVRLGGACAMLKDGSIIFAGGSSTTAVSASTDTIYRGLVFKDTKKVIWELVGHLPDVIVYADCVISSENNLIIAGLANASGSSDTTIIIPISRQGIKT